MICIEVECGCKMLAKSLETIKNNLVHYMYSESQLINKAISYLCELPTNVSMSLHCTYYIHENRTWISIHANYKCA